MGESGLSQSQASPHHIHICFDPTAGLEWPASQQGQTKHIHARIQPRPPVHHQLKAQPARLQPSESHGPLQARSLQSHLFFFQHALSKCVATSFQFTLLDSPLQPPPPSPRFNKKNVRFSNCKSIPRENLHAPSCRLCITHVLEKKQDLRVNILKHITLSSQIPLLMAFMYFDNVSPKYHFDQPRTISLQHAPIRKSRIA